MPARFVQMGDGAVRDLVVMFHLTSELDNVLKAGAPHAIIINDTGPPFQGYYGKIGPLSNYVALAQKSVGVGVTIGKVVIAGFSEGGSATKHLLTLGADPDAVVVADGTHTSLPLVIQGYQVWQQFATKAKDGAKVMCLSHTMLTYVEHLPKPAVSYASTWTVCKLITGWSLDTQGPVTAPVRRQTGDLVCYSYDGADKAAHVNQAMHVIGPLIGEAMKLLAGGPLSCAEPPNPQAVVTATGVGDDPALTTTQTPEDAVCTTDQAPPPTSSGGAGVIVAAAGVGLIALLLGRR